MEIVDAQSKDNDQEPEEAAVTKNSEDTPLMEKMPSSFHLSVLAVRYCSTHKCVSSRAALLILFWSFTLALANGFATNPDTYMKVFPDISLMIVSYGVIPLVLVFYPLAGFLADVKFGRYKTVLRSLYLIIPSLIMTLVVAGLGILFMQDEIGVGLPVSVAMFVLAGVAFIILLIGFTGFTANVIQFGMDQLHDSPGEDRTLFIHWYVWVSFVSIFLAQLTWTLVSYYNFHIIALCVVAIVPLIITLLLVVSVCLGHYKRNWFLIEPGGVNPYKLVYKVSKFAYQHRTPVHRSAFTYCEDELPSGLNLGKDKYGGPFTTEEVEDVKAFYGILKVLFSFEIVLFLDFGVNFLQPAPYMDNYYNHSNPSLVPTLLSSGVLSPLLVAVCIPLHLFLLRPFIMYHIPGMLKRMGIGMCLVLLSVAIAISTEAAYHTENSLCLYNNEFNGSNDTHSLTIPSSLSYTLLVVQNVLSALSHMLIYIAGIEFICSQSPHSMKGLLIGLWFAIRGLYQMFAAALTLPYMFWPKLPISCALGYYLMNILVGVFAVLVYVCVARRYKYRERDEPCYVRRYAEEYYSNPKQERYYDYD